ncbi:NADH dehydrogenase [ubiquinone] iron-sulfur protein 6, mitochondrial [Epinephelus moara]|uniref:NADH dehydrogenase [ubiquinone] iron-sulfur protein 6, mitochondrial n=2 Tax=Epinephelus TaxID=94231 RepID=UPI00214F2502|nr:NADH dehydrogenase [ubiquinone] iron-sulfur protein 6, mitochondrial [Epinephelus moara]
MGEQAVVNMAAAVGRLLSFSRNAKVLASPLRLTAVPVHRYSVEVSSTGEAITHTGQVYDEQDPRRARFVGRQKEVNQNFAIKLVAEEPVTDIEARVVSCDGGGGALGHPKVYINLDKDTKVGTCGYCGLQFKQKHHH